MAEIKAMFIFEAMGKPPEHIAKALGEVVDKLNELKGIRVDKKKIHEAKPIEEEGAEGIFTTFAEVEVTADDLNSALNIVLHTLPSHVEILEPRELKFKNFDLSSTLSTLSTRLHKYDEIAKTSIIEKNILIGMLKKAKGKIEELGGEFDISLSGNKSDLSDSREWRNADNINNSVPEIQAELENSEERARDSEDKKNKDHINKIENGQSSVNRNKEKNGGENKDNPSLDIEEESINSEKGESEEIKEKDRSKEP
jgi:hypothetical protein